jgi:glycerol-3-phosphate cytidylyltransferase
MGTFEIAHAGHAAFLRKCEAFADEIIIGVNTDEFVYNYKRIKPLYPLETRMYRIAVLNPDYKVVPNPSAGRELIMKTMPDVIAIGSDWLHKDYLPQIDMTPDDFDKIEASLLYLPYTQGISSTEIKEKFREQD